MDKLLQTLLFQAQVRIEGKDRDIDNLTTQIIILHLG